MPVELLWDIDGTLITSDDTDQYLYEQAVREAVGAVDVRHPVNRHGKTDLQIIQEYLTSVGAPHSAAPLVKQHLSELSRLAYSNPSPARQILPGAQEALQQAEAEGHHNTVLTGNSRERAHLKVTSSGLPQTALCWQHGHYGDRTGRRSDLAHTARAQAERSNRTPLLVGDTPADAAAAAAAGVPFCGVATGTYSVQELASVPHALVLPDLATGAAELRRLLDTLS